MKERLVSFKRGQKTSYFQVGEALIRRIRSTKVVIFRAVCDGDWDKTRVVFLENMTTDRFRHRTIEIEAEMKLSEFYHIIRPGREIMFYDRNSLDSDYGVELLFQDHGEPVIHDSSKALFRVDIIACNDSFRSKRCLSEGPERDME
jgi:hypothetical protein